MAVSAPAPAKTTRPSGAGLFARPRLFRLLDRARAQPVVWVTGPAGAGKTSLVASYLAARRPRALWYQMDEGDGDVGTFFHYLGLAAARVAARRGPPLPALTPDRWLRLSLFAREYFEALYARLRPPVLLVFDNYHEVPSHSLLHDVIRDGLEALPRGIRVIVLSRHEPPASLARLRASRAFAVLGWEALRLTAEEARGIARRRGQRRLETTAIAALQRATEGWVAGLVLMLEGGPADRPAPGVPAAASSESVFEYFAGEVFRRADAGTRRFLLETAFLPGMSSRMAAELTGMAGAERILADLCRRHYFTERRGQPEPVYQYHGLFRLFLVNRAKETLGPAALTDLQRRAGALLAGAGQVEDAVALVRDAGDWEGLARLVVAEAPSLVAESRSLTLEEWTAALPPDLAERDPWLQYWLGMSRTPLGPSQARPSLERAFHRFRAQGDAVGVFSAWSGWVGTILYEWDDFTRLDPLIELGEALLREYPAFPSVELEARVASNFFAALMFRRPEHPEIGDWAERAFALAREIRDVNRRMLIGFMLATYHLWLGNLAKAALVVESLRALARAPGASPLVRLTWSLVEAYQSWQAGAK